MLQKNTNYNYQIKSIPLNFIKKANQINSQNNRQKVAYLVLLDMLQLIKM
jgi:hypothetical protein